MAIISSADGNTHVLTGGALVTFSSYATFDLGGIGPVTKYNTASGEIKIKNWGKKNDAPTKREELLRNSGIAPGLLSTKRNMVIGKKIYCYQEAVVTKEGKADEIIENEIVTPDDIQAFLNASGKHRFFMECADDLFKQGNVFVEFLESVAGATGSTSGNKYAAMKCQPSRYVRAEKMDETDGDIKNFYWRGDGWQERTDEGHKFEPKAIPAYDAEALEQSGNFLYHTGDPLFSDEYYFIPSYEGVSKFLQIAENIPNFHLENMKGFVIRYQVEISNEIYGEEPDAFASDEDKATFATNKAAKKAEILKGLDTFLGEKPGKAFISHFDVDREMKMIYSHIKITPMKVDLQDKSLLDLLAEAHRAIMSAFQVHPELAMIETTGRLGSGSQTRNIYLLWLAIHATTFREILLEALYLAQTLNGWDPTIKFGFKDVVMTTLSDVPSGAKTQNI